MVPVKISKIDSARRHIDCAIRLWFREEDPTCIHTLAFAGFQIIEDLNSKHGNTEVTLLEILKRQVPPEEIEQVMALAKKAMTFFKHANRDPQGILEFDSTESQGILRLSIIGLSFLGETLTNFQQAFAAWELLHDPHLFVKANEKLQQLGNVVDLERMRQIPRSDFLEHYLLFLAKRSSL